MVPSIFPINYTQAPLDNVNVTGMRPFTAFNCSLVARNSAGVGPPASDTLMTEPDGKREGRREEKRKIEREREKNERKEEKRGRKIEVHLYIIIYCNCREHVHNFYIVLLLFGDHTLYMYM